jgi:hypothetical protein
VILGEDRLADIERAMQKLDASRLAKSEKLDSFPIGEGHVFHIYDHPLAATFYLRP